MTLIRGAARKGMSHENQVFKTKSLSACGGSGVKRQSPGMAWDWRVEISNFSDPESAAD
jgi:hypothetical protein